MNLLFQDGIYTLELSMIATLALALSLLFLGRFLRRKIYFLERFCIPAPVIGGLLFSILTLILHQSNLFAIKMDTTFQSPFMLLFFTCIGLNASLKLVKKGGKALFIYWLLCCFLAISQNTIGVVLAKLVNIHPLLGVMMGAVSMEGGHGAAGAFGPEAEAMGVTGAAVVAMAAATFGLVSGGLIGGPLAKYLITKNHLSPSQEDLNMKQEVAEQDTDISIFHTNSVLVHLTIISICMTIGLVVADSLKASFGIALPGYVGAMFTAVFVRNINDAKKIFPLYSQVISNLGDIGLGIFLSMALMSLRLWELADLAIPMFIILFAQVLWMIFYTLFVVFRLLGKDFDAAIMVAGMAGHGLGATPNAIANMTTVTEKYGPSTKAFLIVPLCGAFLIDLVGIPTIVWFMNAFA